VILSDLRYKFHKSFSIIFSKYKQRLMSICYINWLVLFVCTLLYGLEVDSTCSFLRKLERT